MATSPRPSGVLPALVRRVRERELASDARAGAWARGKARRARYDYLRSHWGLLSFAALVMTAPIIVAAVLIPGALARGFLLGAGLAVIRWRAALAIGEPRLSPEQVEQVWSALDRQARRRDDRDPEPLPPSLARLAARAMLAAAGFLAAATLLSVAGSLLLWVPGCLVLVAAAAPLRRRQRSRLAALAWQTGLGGALLLAAAVALINGLG